MAITLATATRNAMADAAVDLVDAGAAAGSIQFKNAATTVIASATLGDPAFGSAATGSATASGLPLSGAGLPAAGAGDDMASFDVLDSDSNLCWSGTVTATGGGGDCTVDNVNVADGQAFNITGFTFAQPAT